jgi:hypothetical protein
VGEMQVERLDALENAAGPDCPLGWHGRCLAKDSIDEYTNETAQSPQLTHIHAEQYFICEITRHF